MPGLFYWLKAARIGGLFFFEKAITMRIPTTQELEKGMQINYSTILDKKRQMEGKAAARRHRLQQDAIGLMDVLTKSLELPSDYEFDLDNRRLKFIETYVTNQSGLYEKRPASSLPTDGAHVMRFSIGLMVNNATTGGEWIYVPVEMWYEGGELVLVAGKNRSSLRIHGLEAGSGRFNESASLIKSAFIDQLNDPNL